MAKSECVNALPQGYGSRTQNPLGRGKQMGKGHCFKLADEADANGHTLSVFKRKTDCLPRSQAAVALAD